MLIDFSLRGDSAIKQIMDALQKRLTFTDNIASSDIVIGDTGSADTVIMIQHNLGKVPRYFLANLDRAGSVYEFNRPLWTPVQMQLKCSAANAVLHLLVF